MRETFTSHRFTKRTRLTLDHAKEIIDDLYHGQNFRLTLRQLFYQFVGKGWLPNTRKSYGHVCRVIGDARDAGEIDWDAIEDRVRVVNTHSSWGSPADIIKSDTYAYQEDLWRDQTYRPEVWVEKDALVGVIEGVCNEYRVPYFGFRGSPSTSAMYEAGQRFAQQIDHGQHPVVLLLTDHDPTGIDMERDINQAVGDVRCSEP
jgi:hypothetical protein